VALANAAGETLRMADMFEGMLRGAIEVFRSGDRHRAADISRTERIMDWLGEAIRRYLADIRNAQPLDDEDEGARGQEILSAVINLEHAGDIIANNLLEFAARRTRRAGGFAPEELDAIEAMHAELVDSLRLGLTVFLRGDAALRDARRLVVRKRLLDKVRASPLTSGSDFVLRSAGCQGKHLIAEGCRGATTVTWFRGRSIGWPGIAPCDACPRGTGRVWSIGQSSRMTMYFPGKCSGVSPAAALTNSSRNFLDAAPTAFALAEAQPFLKRSRAFGAPCHVK
jgi:hypothetical protein